MSGSAPMIIITDKQLIFLSEFAVFGTISVSLAQRSLLILIIRSRSPRQDCSGCWPESESSWSLAASLKSCVSRFGRSGLTHVQTNPTLPSEEWKF